MVRNLDCVFVIILRIDENLKGYFGFMLESVLVFYYGKNNVDFKECFYFWYFNFFLFWIWVSLLIFFSVRICFIYYFFEKIVIKELKEEIKFVFFFFKGKCIIYWFCEWLCKC